MSVIIPFTEYLNLRATIMNIKALEGQKRGIDWSDAALENMACGELRRLALQCDSLEQIKSLLRDRVI